MSEYRVPLDKVEKFLMGHDDEKYIVNLEYDPNTNLIYKIKHMPDGSKITETELLKSFMWIKNLNEVKKKYRFYENNDIKIKLAREEYGIEIKALQHYDHPKLVDGYRYLVTCKYGHKKMLEFFEKGGIFRGIYNPDLKDNFLVISPIEQYLISTGKRLFKGYEEYHEVDKFVFDLETTGLDPHTSRIFLIGCKSNKGLEEVFECETEGPNADQSEIEAIVKFFMVIDHLKPAIIGAYNSANFDWDFIFTRCEILGVDITKIAKTLKSDSLINRKEQMLKLGNEVEKYMQVNMFGYSNIDIIHSARRAQAIDSSMKSASLKYVCKYNKINKKNRVYIKGDKISSLWKQNEAYYFEDKTGTYTKSKPKIEYMDFITRQDLKDNKNKIFVFGDNDERSGYGGQAKEMRGESNAIGVPTKKSPNNTPDSYYTDLEFDENKKKINFAINKIINEIKNGKTIVFPNNGIGTGLADLPNKAPKTFKFLQATITALELFVDSYKVVTGQYIVKRYLMDDLWETMEIDNVYNQSSFMLAKLIPTTYQRVSTMGTASLWKMLMLTWSYENNLGIPISDEKRDFTGGLSRLLSVGYSVRLRKMDFNSLYPAIQLAHDVFPSVDVMGVMKSFLKYFHSERFKAKNLAKKYGKGGNKQLESLYKRKQLPLKTFINSMFGALGAPNAFPWAEMNVAEGITTRARQYLRLMVKFFMKKGYVATVLDTDGVNFMAPEGLEDNFEYIGKGLNDEVKEGCVYKGVNAVVAEFNDLYMQGEMALGLDGMWPSTINLSRKNYALLEDDGSISLTGNTIKSKKLPIYIEEFLDTALTLLLNGKGYDFVQYYYSYIDKIYNKKIPLSKIATKARIKKSIETYLKRGNNKNGQPLPKQAHMELAILNNLPISLGDTIYYVNNGVKKSDGDIQTIKKCKLKASEVRDYKINNGKPPGREFYDITEKINCYLLTEDDLENNPNKMGDYNVAKYISNFNTRVRKLLIAFNRDVRGSILIKTPDEKKSWLYSELELTNGQPFKDSEQDTIDELFTPSDNEIVYWDQFDYHPDFWFQDNLTFRLPGLNKVSKV